MKCATCHAVELRDVKQAPDSGDVGPALTPGYGRLPKEYLAESIEDPNAEIVAGFNPNIMPQNYQEQFTIREEEVFAAEAIEIDIAADIISYIKTLQ